MTIYALIPTRSGLKRIKNKNILKLNNKNLIQIIIEQALKTKKINKIFFQQTLKNIKNQYRCWSRNSVLRNKKISKDLSTDLECFKDFLCSEKSKYIIGENIFFGWGTYSMLKIISIIPARNGSKRIKDKKYKEI